MHIYVDVAEMITYAIICKTDATGRSTRTGADAFVYAHFARGFVGGLPDCMRQMQNQQITYIRLTYYDIHMYVCICMRRSNVRIADDDG